MTNQEAIKWLHEAEILDLTCGKNNDRKAVDLAIKALEKQIPKKFKIVDDYTPICPVCGEEVWVMEWCNSCGQRIGDEFEEESE